MHKATIAAFILFAAAGILIAQEKEATKSLSRSLSAGLTMTDGNSDTLQGNLSLKIEGEKERLGSVLAGLEANYGESAPGTKTNTAANGESSTDNSKEKTVDNARAYANAKKTITPMTFGYLDGSALYDDMAKIDYRVTAGPGLGAYIFKSDLRALSVEAGPSYVLEKVQSATDDFVALRTAERFTCAIGKSSKIWQSAECLFKTDDFGDYFLTAEAGAEAAMTEILSLRLVLQCRYDSTPGEGLVKRDTTLIAGLTVSL